MEYFVLNASKKVNLNEIEDLYTSLSRGKINSEPSKKIQAFLNDLNKIYPHKTSMYDNLNDYPWKSSSFEVGHNGVILSISSRVSHVPISQLIEGLCKKHDLMLYDANLGRCRFS